MATRMNPAPALPKLRMYIGGSWVEPASGEYFESYDPYTAEPWCLVPRGNAEDVDRAVTAAHRAFTQGPWSKLNATQRGAVLRKLGDLVAENADALGEMEVRDNGKLLTEMRAQLRYCPNWYYYFGGLADKIEGAVLPTDKPAFTYTRHEPLGVCVAITPWNSPLLLATMKLAPALAAGNTMVIKPSEYTSASTIEFFKRVIEQAGLPEGVVNVVTGFGPEAGGPLVEHPLVRKIAFTGSDRTGAHVYSTAAKDIKRVSLELGGKSPNIVFADANMDDAVMGAVAGIFAATGQTCIAGSRLLVQENIHNEFLDRLVDFAKTAKMGNPMDAATQVGPVTNLPQYEKVLGYIEVGKDEGAEVVLGGSKASRPECGRGWFVEPTIFRGVDNSMRIAQEEVFGPVLSVIPFKDDEEAVAIGNDVVFGLAAGVWTQNIRRAITMAERLHAGTVWVNTYRAVSFTTPFGGYKRSGLGRENGKDAILEYMQTKSVWISTAESMSNPFVMR